MKTKCNQEYEVYKKSIKFFLKKKPVLVGAVCFLFFAIVLIWLGVILTNEDKKEKQINFYKPTVKSKKIQMDFFNADPFANSSSRKKKIRKTKSEYRQDKIKSINKPVVILAIPDSSKKPKVSITSPMLFKKKNDNNKKSINVYSGSMKPQPIIDAAREINVCQDSPVLFKKVDDDKQSSKKTVERLVLKKISREKKNYYVKFSRILVWSKNKANWKIGIKFIRDNKKWKEIIVKLNDTFNFGKDKYKLCYIEVPKWVLNYKKDYRFKGKKESFKLLHRNDRIYLKNVNSGEGAYIKFNKKWCYSNIFATLIDSYTKKTYVIQNQKRLALENKNNYEVKLSHTDSSKYAILINAQGKKYYVRKSSNLTSKSFQPASDSRIKRIIVGQNSVDFK